MVVSLGDIMLEIIINEKSLKILNISKETYIKALQEYADKMTKAVEKTKKETA